MLAIFGKVRGGSPVGPVSPSWGEIVKYTGERYIRLMLTGEEAEAAIRLIAARRTRRESHAKQEEQG